MNKVLPGIGIPLMAKVHDNLLDPRVGSYLVFNLKNTYWSILVEKQLKYLLAFTVLGFAQIQPIRMPQGTKSAIFSILEAIRITIGPIPAPYPKPSLMQAGPGCP